MKKAHLKYVGINLLAIVVVIMGLWYITIGRLTYDTTLFKILWEWIRMY